MKAQEIIAKYDSLEERWGADAPVAMLKWCRLAANTVDDNLQALVPVLERILVQRCIDVFNAEHRAEEDPIAAYQRAADEARRIVHTAASVEAMAPAEEDSQAR